jgi:hypothetical protein
VVEDRTEPPIVHFVGSVPLPDGETVFRTLAQTTGPYLQRLPDGETGIRKTWIRFLQQVLLDNPAIEVATDVPPFKFTQWDGKLLREIPRLRVKPGATLDPTTFGDRLCRHGDRLVEAVRAAAARGRHSHGGQISDLAADADRRLAPTTPISMESFAGFARMGPPHSVRSRWRRTQENRTG